MRLKTERLVREIVEVNLDAYSLMHKLVACNKTDLVTIINKCLPAVSDDELKTLTGAVKYVSDTLDVEGAWESEGSP